MPARPRWHEDPSPGAWLQEELTRWPSEDGTVRVHSLVSSRYEAYARILHPFYSHGPNIERIRWHDVARDNGKVIHPEVEWHKLVGLADPRGHLEEMLEPHDGRLDEVECAALAQLLGRFTSTPDRCWFAVWYGYGDWDIRVPQFDARLLELPYRSYLIYEGPVAAATSFRTSMTFHSANIWWPEDRAWCVATEIDLYATYVGGSAECIEAILASDAFESVPSRPDARVDWQADTIN
jgi:hypothetical protein